MFNNKKVKQLENEVNDLKLQIEVLKRDLNITQQNLIVYVNQRIEENKMQLVERPQYWE